MWMVDSSSAFTSPPCRVAEHVINPSDRLALLDSPDLLLLEVRIKSGLGVLLQHSQVCINTYEHNSEYCKILQYTSRGVKLPVL